MEPFTKQSFGAVRRVLLCHGILTVWSEHPLCYFHWMPRKTRILKGFCFCSFKFGPVIGELLLAFSSVANQKHAPVHKGLARVR